MEIRPVEEQSLFCRRLRKATPKSLECDLQIAPPPQSSECELDPDAFKTYPDVKEWVWKTALKISHKRPSLTFSPSFLLSPICLSPVLIDEELVSPFASINQLIAKPKNSNTSDISTASKNESTSPNVFTFDEINLGNDHFSSSGPITSNRRLCAIPEDREIAAIDLEMTSDSTRIQIFHHRKADVSLAPPKSPSIAIATKSKENAVKKKNQDQQKKPDNSKNRREIGEKQSQPNRRKPKNCQKNNRTLAKGYEAKRIRSGNSMFLSMVTR